MIYERDYYTIQGYECLSSCISNYLNYKKVPILGYDIFLIGDGFHITYTNEKTPIIRSKMFQACLSFLKKMNITYEYTRFYDSQSDEFLRAQVEAEKNICIKVSSEYLNYNSVFKQSNNSSHFINIIGYDKKKENYYVSDGYIPTCIPSSFEGWVHKNEILEAWKRKKNEFLVFDMKKAKIDIDNVLESSILKLKEGINSYLNAYGDESLIAYHGYKAIEVFMEDVHNMFNYNSDLKSVALDVNDQLRIYGFLTIKKFIVHKIKNLGFDESLILEYEEILKTWDKICLVILKAGFSKNKMCYETAIKMAAKVNREEKKLLLKVYKSL